MNLLLTGGLLVIGIMLITIIVRTIAGLFGMFKTNSFTGKVKSAHRDWTTNEVLISIAALSGSGTRTFRAGDPLALEIEMLIVSYRREQQPFIITVEFDPRDGVSIIGYSIVKE
jgi:hypothetical protein